MFLRENETESVLGFGAREYVAALAADLRDLYLDNESSHVLEGLDVTDGNMKLAGGQRPREDGVRVAFHENAAGGVLRENRFELGQHFRGLLGVRATPHVEGVVRGWEVELFEEDGVHFGRVVLAGVDEVKGQALALELAQQGRELRDFGTRAEHDSERLHGKGEKQGFKRSGGRARLRRGSASPERASCIRFG